MFHRRKEKTPEIQSTINNFWRRGSSEPQDPLPTDLGCVQNTIFYGPDILPHMTLKRMPFVHFVDTALTTEKISIA